MKSRFFSERKRPLKKSVSNLKAVFNLNDVNIISNPTPHDKLNSSRMKSNYKTITDERENDDDAKRPKVGYSGTRNTEATSPRSLAAQTLNKLKTFSTGNDDSSVDSLLSQNKGTEEMSTYSSASEDVPMTLSTPESSNSKYTPESSSSKYTPESSSSKYIPESSSSKYTPLELQVVELKRKHPGMILLVQNAYKYTFFGEDAQIAGKVLNICTTMYNNFLTAVIPTMRLHVHLRRLVEEGHKVGVVNQVESFLTRSTSENKNIVFNRQLVGVYSKATLIGDDVNPLLCAEEGLAAYILCLAEGQGSTLDSLTIGMAAFDPSTGEMIYDMFEDGANRNELERRLEHLNPTEVIVAENVSANTHKLLQHRFICIRRQPNEVFDFTSCLVKVASFFSSEGTISSSNFQNLGDFAPTTLCCVGVLLNYVKECGLESSLKAEGFHKFTDRAEYLQLDAAVLRNLSVFSSTEGSTKNTLYSVLDHTRTKFGARLLHQWISQPLRNLVKVRQRQDMVEELIGSESGLREELLNVLEGLPDLERGLTTILNLKCKPLGFYVVVTSLGNVRSKLQSLLNSDTERHNDRTRQLITETVQLLSDVGLFANNLDQEAARKEDKANLLIDKSEFPTLVDRQMKVSILLSQLEALKPSIALVIGSERFEYSSVGGHDFLIEVKITLPVPSTWRLVSQTKQFNRFRSPGVDVLVTELVHLQEILVCDGEEVWLHTLEHFNTFYFPHKRAVKNLATLDVLLSLSEVSRQNEYCKPLLLDHKGEAVIKVEQGRHPIVSLIFSHNSEQYVPNNTELVSSEQCCMIVSGPNMGGKSCYLRQVALIVIMAHIGSFVPAKSATISLLDAVYVRMGARDELFTGRSTLLLELEETQVILNCATQHSLVLMDELGRGTSSCDGAAIATATLHHLVTQVKCLTLFVTHYPSVTQLTKVLSPSAQNYHVAFMVKPDDDGKAVTLLYSVVEGLANESFGLNVARLANIRTDVLSRASHYTDILQSRAASTRAAQLKMLMMEGDQARIALDNLFSKDVFG